MKNARNCLLAFSAAGSLLVATDARAQLLWNALDTKPKANMIIGYDTSTTMQIDAGCTVGCHAYWGGWSWGVIPWSDTRLYQATQELSNTLQIFRDQFVYGGFRYDTCGGTFRGHDTHNSGPGWADIQYHVMPDVTNVTQSYNNVFQMVQDIQNASDVGASGPTAFRMCEHGEQHMSGGGGQPVCFTNTPGCSGDAAWGVSVMSDLNTMIPGLEHIPPVPIGTDMVCDDGTTLSAQSNLTASYATWVVPHYTSRPTEAQVGSDICDPLDTFFNNLNNAMVACQSDPAVRAAYFDMSFYTGHGQGHWCKRGRMRDELCNTWHGGSGSVATNNSCICHPEWPNCLGPGASPCGVPYTFKARQQVAVCESYDPHGFGAAFAAQGDNVVNGQCRQNVVLFFTDGAYGNTTGVAAEGTNATATTYASTDVPPMSNAFVFRAGGSFQTTEMAQALGHPSAYDATNQTSLNTSFAEVVNRVQKGVYKSANLGFDTVGTRVAVTSFTVPGHPNPADASIPDESYIGRPSRISWYSVNPDTGVRSATPICETDWSSRAGYPGMAGGSAFLHQTLHGPTGAIRSHIGPPTTQNWSSGAPMFAYVPRGRADRDGNGVGNQASDMTADDLDYGFMLNAGPTTPVIVEAPRDMPMGANAHLFAQYQTDSGSPIAGRPRMIYTMAGGYLFGFYGGAYRATTRTVGGVHLGWDYDDSNANACREVFRYLPNWVLSAPGYANAAQTPQQLTTGQIAVREVQLASANNVNDFGTLLVMTEGSGGPHVSALEVTDPMHPSIIGEWALPGANDTATVEPAIYEFPNGASTRPVVVLTGGDGGSPTLYAYSVARTGVALLSSIALPADQYDSSPVCFDGKGRGSMTDCVLLGENGTLVRVPIDRNGRFTLGYVDLTASYSGLRVAGEKFYTHPAVYFGNDGKVNYVFGSGDVKNLATPPTVVNQVYKVRDDYARGNVTGATTSNVCVADGTGSTTGVIHLGANEVVVSPPIVARGVVAFTTYAPGNNGCSAGNAYLYAMNYDSCKDALAGTPPARPVGHAIGQGIPMSPSYLRGSDTLVTQTSNGTMTPVGAHGRGNGSTNQNKSGLVPLYWRTELKSL